MLTEIRDRSSGWFAWIIAALIIIPMAFWGVQEYASTEARPVLVEFGDQKIYQDQFQQQLTNQQQRATQANPNLANSDIFNSEFYKRNVLSNMVDRSLVRHIAAEKNYKIGDQHLASLIKKDPIFQTNGTFDPALYQNYMANSGMFSKKQFEDNIRENSTLGQVSAGYQESALVLPDEVRAMLEIQAEKRTFDLITINKTDFNEKVSVSDDEIQAYYNDNLESYMEPDQRSVEYVELVTDALAENIEVSEEEIQSAYDDYVAGFSENETRNTRHILLGTNGDNDDAQLAKANTLVSQLRAGADFATLAKENSDDSASANDGGSLGEVERGTMVAEFEEATFTAEVDAISEPVKSDFGYHIIKVDKINATAVKSLDEMRFDLSDDVKNYKAQDLALEKAEELRNILFEQPETLEGAAALIGSEIKTSDLFSRASGSGIATNEAIRSAAFSEQVTNENLNSELIELPNGVYVALRKKEYVPSAPKPLESVSARIKSVLVAKKASDAAQELGVSLLAKAEQNWSALEADENVNIKTLTISLIDTDRKAAPEVVREVVKTQLQDSTPTITSFAGSNGDFNIIRLNKIEPGDLTKVSEQVKDSTRRMLEARNGESLFSAYLNGLEKSIKPTINDELL